MDSASGESVAKIVQRRLRKNDIDFAAMTTEEGVNEILKLLQEDNSSDRRRDALLPKGTRLEAATVKERKGSLTRKTITAVLRDR